MTNVDPKFFDITLGNVISWGVIIAAGIAAWQKLKDKTEELKAAEKRIEDRLDKQDKMLNEIKDQGSPSSRNAIDTLNRRLDDQKQTASEARKEVESRLERVEEAFVRLGKMESNIEWITKTMQRGC